MPGVPLAEGEQFCTDDLDVIRVIGSEVLVPHHVDALAPLRPNARLNAAKLGGTTLAYMDYKSKMRLTAPTTERTFFITLPLTGRAEASRGSRGGREYAPSAPGKGVAFASDEWGQITLGAGYQQFFLRIERPTLEAKLSGLLDRDVTAPLRFEFSVDLQRPTLRTWVDCMNLLRSTLERGPDAETPPLLADKIEDMVLTGLLVGQPNNYSEALHTPHQLCRPRTVKLVIDLMEAQPEQHLSLSDMARVAGVSARTLQDAFKRYVGISPTAYLRDVRLHRVRAELTNATSQVSVTEVASRWGFTHLGRFSAAYRQRFGESPSQTAREHVPPSRGGGWAAQMDSLHTC